MPNTGDWTLDYPDGAPAESDDITTLQRDDEQIRLTLGDIVDALVDPLLAALVAKAAYNANTILAATDDDTPAAVTIGEDTMLGRLTGGSIAALTPAELRTLLDVPTNAEAILDTLLTTQGDIIYASAANTPATLAAGTAYQRLRMNLAGTAPEWVTVGELLTSCVYDPGTTATYTTTSATLGDIDATNLVVTFTAPASGKVLVRLGARISTSATAALTWGLRSGSSQVGGLFMLGSALNFAGAYQSRAGDVYVTSLTPGTSYTYKWAWAISGGITFGLKAGQTSGDEGAAVMQVFSA